ncbi:MAG: dTMP kinase [Candidatus Paceibacterota bacterium]|jgi:dTMP kinase|nr:dTMP kinase [Candidatus Paceibacterota bacterium]MDD4831070.1 dTMP kinase [Candidatus Paceibacterota bacterium]MDD4875465.1 dTMP kinase [Candidatus Paceibacterota bacterium]
MAAKNKRGKFIVLEGIDGAGVETHGRLLTDYLRKNRLRVERLYYPDYEGPIGKMIHDYLHKSFNLSPEVQFLVYTADFVKDKEKLKKWLEQGKIIVSDRYFSSTLAYQSIQGVSLKKSLQMAKALELPKPDLVIYIDISPKVSMERKLKEKNSLDRNENNEKLLRTVRNFYKELAKDKTFAKWIVLNGERPIEEIFEEIKKKLPSDLKASLKRKAS